MRDQQWLRARGGRDRRLVEGSAGPPARCPAWSSRWCTTPGRRELRSREAVRRCESAMEPAGPRAPVPWATKDHSARAPGRRGSANHGRRRSSALRKSPSAPPAGPTSRAPRQVRRDDPVLRAARFCEEPFATRTPMLREGVQRQEDGHTPSLGPCSGDEHAQSRRAGHDVGVGDAFELRERVQRNIG
jgi:hypothetical protein